ncbi:MAG: hypothetical protein ACXVPQ_09315 [Bacteroidia bacterium]
MAYYKYLFTLTFVVLSANSMSAHQKAKFPHPEKLENKTSSITVSYGGVACECAQWVLTGKADKREYIYLEPASKKLIDAEKIWDGMHLPLQFKLRGKFYNGIGFPQNYHPEKGDPGPARVFRYDKIEILSPYFKNRKHWGG